MTPNEAIITEFANQFTPPLRFCRTDRINNVRIQDAWQASYWSDEHAIGITAVAHSGGLHAFIEAAGSGNIAANVGRVFAATMRFMNEQGSTSPTAAGGMDAAT